MTIIILFPLQLLFIVVFQAVMNPFTSKTINGMFEMVWGADRCTYTIFFLISQVIHLPVIPWHPIYTLGSICVLNCKTASLQSWNRMLPTLWILC